MSAPPRYDTLYTNLHLATMVASTDDPYGSVADAAIAVDAGRITWLGRRADAPPGADAVHDGAGRWLTPGLVD